LSNRYSLSPALRLQIADSRARRLGFIALVVFYLLTGCLCAHRGYPELALVFAGCGALVLPGIGRHRWAGTQVTWRRGIWSLEVQGQRRTVEVLPTSLALPWVIYLALRDQPLGRSYYLWLFNDSATAQELRKLRVRLRLPQT
jgi:hypothetical protein